MWTLHTEEVDLELMKHFGVAIVEELIQFGKRSGYEGRSCLILSKINKHVVVYARIRLY
jgi:hypothetical protein